MFSTTLLQQRTALVLGVANQRSLAWSCALALLRGEFNHVIVTYQNDRFKKSVESLVFDANNLLLSQRTAEDVHKRLSCLACDISDDSQIDSMFREDIPHLLVSRRQEQQPSIIKLDALVHCIAFAPSTAMKDSGSEFPLLNTSQKDFEMAHSISAHSLLSVSRHALPLLSCCGDDDGDTMISSSVAGDGDGDGVGSTFESHSTDTTREKKEAQPKSSSITALTYLGSIRAVRNYNVMGPAKASLEACVRGLAMELSPPPHGIRVNAVSAGPVNTLAARGIRDFNRMKNHVQEQSFLQRCVTGEEVGNVVEFLAGSKASGITGQVVFCDGGYSSSSGG